MLKMLRAFLTLFLVQLTLSENCVKYTFEEGFDDLFSNERGICSVAGITSWECKDYKDTAINTQPESSTKFISPKTSPSCGSSLVFPMSAGGIVEVNIYMESEEYDQIAVLVHRVVNGTNDAVVGSAGASPLFPQFIRGWQTLRLVLSGTGTYDGYVSMRFLFVSLYLEKLSDTSSIPFVSTNVSTTEW